MRIPIDYIAATSMGAIVGGLYASGMSPEEMQRHLGGVSWPTMLSDSPGRLDDYWRTVTADKRDIKFNWKLFAVNGYTAVAHWSAKFRLESTGAIIELDGMFVLEFNPENPGQCSALAEWWHVRSSK
jgi:hypothetical protein